MKTTSIYVYKTQPKLRVKVKTSYGIETVFIEPCYESWQQYGSISATLWHTLPIAEYINSTGYFRDFKESQSYIADYQQILTDKFVK